MGEERVSPTHLDPKDEVLVISGLELTVTDDARVWRSGDYFLRLRDDLAWDLYRGGHRTRLACPVGKEGPGAAPLGLSPAPGPRPHKGLLPLPDPLELATHGDSPPRGPRSGAAGTVGERPAMPPHPNSSPHRRRRMQVRTCRYRVNRAAGLAVRGSLR